MRAAAHVLSVALWEAALDLPRLPNSSRSDGGPVTATFGGLRHGRFPIRNGAAYLSPAARRRRQTRSGLLPACALGHIEASTRNRARARHHRAVDPGVSSRAALKPRGQRRRSFSAAQRRSRRLGRATLKHAQGGPALIEARTCCSVINQQSLSARGRRANRPGIEAAEPRQVAPGAGTGPLFDCSRRSRVGPKHGPSPAFQFSDHAVRSPAYAGPH